MDELEDGDAEEGSTAAEGLVARNEEGGMQESTGEKWPFLLPYVAIGSLVDLIACSFRVLWLFVSLSTKYFSPGSASIHDRCFSRLWLAFSSCTLCSIIR
jgi:hypothetical protein